MIKQIVKEAWVREYSFLSVEIDTWDDLINFLNQKIHDTPLYALDGHSNLDSTYISQQEITAGDFETVVLEAYGKEGVYGPLTTVIIKYSGSVNERYASDYTVLREGANTV